MNVKTTFCVPVRKILVKKKGINMVGCFKFKVKKMKHWLVMDEYVFHGIDFGKSKGEL